MEESLFLSYIKTEFFPLVKNLSLLLDTLISDLERKNLDDEFHHKIRFFGITFDNENCSFSNVESK